MVSMPTSSSIPPADPVYERIAAAVDQILRDYYVETGEVAYGMFSYIYDPNRGNGETVFSESPGFVRNDVVKRRREEIRAERRKKLK